MSPKKHLVLISSSFPYDGDAEHTFLNPELEYLVRTFDRVTLVPGRIRGDKRSYPSSVALDETFATLQTSDFQKIFRSCSSLFRNAHFFKEWMAHFWIVGSPKTFRRFVAFSGAAFLFYEWALHFIQKQAIPLENTLFYTYWLDAYSLGLALLKEQFPQLCWISRAHGIDLYPERWCPPYQPFRPFIFQSIRRLYCISEHGKDYLCKTYPQFADRFHLARLGVGASGHTAIASPDSTFRIVSCSTCLPVKRIERLIHALSELHRVLPSAQVLWHHFGDGPLRESLQELSRRLLPKNIRSIFHGHVENTQLLNFYRQNHVDLFMNTSESEGIPVTLMEAQSFGIPALALHVGGIPEIVTPKNGVLLSQNSSSQDIAGALKECIKHKAQLEIKKQDAQNTWKRFFNADQNYQVFAEELRDLILQTT